jgi:hypothetical protein
MKAFLAVGLVMLLLGVHSLFVPIPRSEREGFKVGGLSIGVETRHDERVSPIIGGVLILSGMGLLIAGKRRST